MRFLTVAAVASFAAVLVAIVRGHRYRFAIRPITWAHLLKILVAPVPVPAMLACRRDGALHRLR